MPENRGLDAFKWSIVYGKPVGVTIHAIDEHIDKGSLLHKIKVPILENDTLRDVADRAYEMECDLQSNFDLYISRIENEVRMGNEFPLSRTKIPHDMDKQLESIFQRQKQKLISLSY